MREHRDGGETARGNIIDKTCPPGDGAEREEGGAPSAEMSAPGGERRTKRQGKKMAGGETD
ncbi:MAG: hypothetical protein IKD79_04120, partial [Oscillospiraceae bacterium]|nr:hypothetical protein [Oscillospiraceae bacterium]